MPLFLHRETYRRRRVMDAARLLPSFGAALLLLPVLWDSTHATSSGAVYLFGAWAALIVCAMLLARWLSAPLRRQGTAGTGPQPAAHPGAQSEAMSDAPPGATADAARGSVSDAQPGAGPDAGPDAAPGAGPAGRDDTAGRQDGAAQHQPAGHEDAKGQGEGAR